VTGGWKDGKWCGREGRWALTRGDGLPQPACLFRPFVNGSTFPSSSSSSSSLDPHSERGETNFQQRIKSIHNRQTSQQQNLSASATFGRASRPAPEHLSSLLIKLLSSSSPQALKSKAELAVRAPDRKSCSSSSPPFPFPLSNEYKKYARSQTRKSKASRISDRQLTEFDGV